MKTKNFNCRGSRWNEVKKSELGAKFITIHRPVSYSFLQRYGQMATAIDVLRSEVPLKYQ